MGSDVAADAAAAPVAATKPVIVFDGVCNLCNRSVDFIVRRDRAGVFSITPNQGETAQRLLGSGAGDLDTIALVEGTQVTTRSTAALRIVRRLPYPWRLLYAGVIVPRPLRDLLYRLIARNRYRWFGRRDTCRLPTAAEAERFLP